MSSGKVPYRTCIACGTRSEKRELIRIVRTPHSGIVIAATGRESGRGAYLCRNMECWEKGLRRSLIERALGTKLTAEEQRRLLEYVQTLKESQQV